MSKRVGEREAEIGSVVALPHFVQDARGRKQRGIAYRTRGRGKGPVVRAATMRCVERLGDRSALGEQLAGPVAQLYFIRTSVQAQPRLASTRGDSLLVASDSFDFFQRIRRTVVEQAMQEKDVQEPGCFRCDADRRERVEIHGADLDILHAALA